MATHFSVLAWEIPWTEEPGSLQSMGSQKSQTQLSNWAYSMHALRIKPALGIGEKDENEQGTDPALKNLTVERRQEMHLKDTAR